MLRLLPVGMVMAVASSAFAQDHPEMSYGRVSVEAHAGYVGRFDDSDLWHSGYTAGIGGFLWLSESVHVGACFALTHWSYIPDEVVRDLVPDNGTLLATQSTGQLEMLELIPSIRWERDEILPARLGAFVQGGVGVSYVKTFRLTEVKYEVSPDPPVVAKSEVNESTVRVGVALAVGLTRPVSTSSWLEVFPSYRGIFTDETVHVFGISIGFRVLV